MAINPNRIDVHHHIAPPEYLSTLATIGINNVDGVSFPKWDVESTLEFMDRQGISAAITSISAPGIYFGDSDFAQDLARRCNEISADLVNKYPQRFGAFASLPLPDVENSLIELEYALDSLNLDGVVLLTNINGKYIGDPLFNDLFSELNRRKAVVFIHPNSPPPDKIPLANFRSAILEFVFDTTRAVANLIHGGALKRYPDIRFILSHAGGTVPYLTWRITFGKKKLINYLKRFYYDTALSGTSYTLRSLQELVDPSQILFGSDYPFLPERASSVMIEGIDNYNGFDKQTRMAIAYENALALFPRFKSD